MRWKCPKCHFTNNYSTIKCPCGYEATGKEEIVGQENKGNSTHKKEELVIKKEEIVVFAVLFFGMFFALTISIDPITCSLTLLAIILAVVIFGVSFALNKIALKHIYYAASITIFITALASTVGVKHIPQGPLQSKVLDKKEDVNVGYRTRYLVKVACKDAEKEYLMVSLFKSDYNKLRVGQGVKIRYVSLSILGIWKQETALEKIDDFIVVSSGGIGFRGGLIDKLISIFMLFSGLFPLSYLIYMDYIRKPK